AEELFDANFLERVHADDLPRRPELFGRAEGNSTFRYRHRDGSWRWLQASGHAFVAPGGQERSVLMIHDITDRKHAEAECQRLETHLRQSQRMGALGTLAGG